MLTESFETMISWYRGAGWRNMELRQVGWGCVYDLESGRRYDSSGGRIQNLQQKLHVPYLNLVLDRQDHCFIIKEGGRCESCAIHRSDYAAEHP